MSYDHENPKTWPNFHPLIIAHDVGHTRDRSTAVVGGNSPFPPRRLGILDFRELPIGLYGRARASELAKVDRYYNHNALIVADLSNDATYAETLYETFGRRVILHMIRLKGEQDVDENFTVYLWGAPRVHWRLGRPHHYGPG